MARNRFNHLVTMVVVWAALGLGAAQAAAAAVHVKVRVEGPTATVTQSDPVPITGTFAGHPLSTPTALGALLAAGRQHHFPVALQWFDCCGFFVNSIAGVPGDATHFWAFKVGHTLSSIGAGSVPATRGPERPLLLHHLQLRRPARPSRRSGSTAAGPSAAAER